MFVTRLRRRLTARLFAAVFTLGALAVVLTAVVSYRSSAGVLEERMLTQLRVAADVDAERLVMWLDRQRAATEELARRLSEESASARVDTAAPLPLLPPELLAAEAISLLAVPGGRVLRSTDASVIGTYAVDELHYTRGQGGTFTQPLYPEARTGRPRLTISAPVRDVRGATVAVLAVHLELARMEGVLSPSEQGVTVNAYLVNRLAELVSAERFGRDGVQRGVHTAAVRSALAGERGTGLYADYTGRPVVGAWRWMPELELALVRESPQAEAFGPARALLARTLVVGFVAVSLLALGVAAIARRFTQPVLAVADAAARVAGGDFSVRAPEGSTDEVGELARTFNGMTERLRAVYDALETQVRATRMALTEADASRALLQDVVNTTTTFVLVVDLDGRVRLTNSRLVALTRSTVVDPVGRVAAEWLGEAGAGLVPLLDAARHASDVFEREVSFAGDEADAHAWQVAAFPLRHADGTPYATALIGTDLTERARAEADRRARDASVQQAQKLESLGIMAGGIAHDFNNLLGAILGNVELARDALHTPGGVQELHLSLDQIGAAGRRAAELTRQMLAYAGRASLRRDIVDLRAVVHDLVPLVRAAQSKKVQIEVESMPEPLWVELDPAQLSQVLLNLLTNAAEAIGDAPGRVMVRAWAGPAPVEAADVQPDAPWVLVSVEDTGPGIPAAMQARIFDPFFSTKASGRGLGLSAVRGIVQSLGGTLQLTSPPVGGARFLIGLPAAESPAAARAEASPVPSTAQGTVLVIDDEPSMRLVARRVIERSGLQVLEARDGAEGVAVFDAHVARLSLVLLDLTMPKLNGAEVLAHIRRVRTTLPVIVASGYDASDATNEWPADPHTQFLQKPFGVQALRDLLLETLGPVASAVSAR